MVTMGIKKIENILLQTSNCQNPKYKLKLTLYTKINWGLKNNKTELDYFEFPYLNRKKIMHAQPQVFMCNFLQIQSRFKELISGKVTFKGGKRKLLIQNKNKVYSAQSVLNQQIYSVKAIEKSFLKLSENGSGLVQILRNLQPYPNNFLVLKEIYEGDNTLSVITSYLEGLSLSGELENKIYYIKDSSKKKTNIVYKNRNEKLFQKLEDFALTEYQQFQNHTIQCSQIFLIKASFQNVELPGCVGSDNKYNCRQDLKYRFRFTNRWNIHN